MYSNDSTALCNTDLNKLLQLFPCGSFPSVCLPAVLLYATHSDASYEARCIVDALVVSCVILIYLTWLQFECMASSLIKGLSPTVSMCLVLWYLTHTCMGEWVLLRRAQFSG